MLKIIIVSFRMRHHSKNFFVKLHTPAIRSSLFLKNKKIHLLMGQHLHIFHKNLLYIILFYGLYYNEQNIQHFYKRNVCIY